VHAKAGIPVRARNRVQPPEPTFAKIGRQHRLLLADLGDLGAPCNPFTKRVRWSALALSRSHEAALRSVPRGTRHLAVTTIAVLFAPNETLNYHSSAC
jgi:hypothetical protein